MKAALISLGSKSSQLTIEAMKKYFDNVDDIRLKQIEVHTSKDSLQVLYKKEKFPDYDCIYAKGSFRYPLLLCSITEAFYNKCYMPIKPEVFAIGHDKWLTHLALQQHNIPMPKTYLSPTVDYAKTILKEIKYPIVMKFPSGTQGKGVMFAESYSAASSMLDALSVLNQPVIMQEYIETEGVDIRAIVCGDKVVASMKRIASPEEKRANIHAGGIGEAYEPDYMTKRIAIKTANAIGADICAVDMLESVKGPLVIEINLSPGLQGITKATNVDVADKIAKFLFNKTKEFVENKNVVGTTKVFKDLGIDESSKGKIKEIITHLDFRGNRILLPESITDMTKFSEKDEYIVKVEGDTLIIKKSKISKR